MDKDFLNFAATDAFLQAEIPSARLQSEATRHFWPLEGLRAFGKITWNPHLGIGF